MCKVQDLDFNLGGNPVVICYTKTFNLNSNVPNLASEIRFLHWIIFNCFFSTDVLYRSQHAFGLVALVPTATVSLKSC